MTPQSESPSGDTEQIGGARGAAGRRADCQGHRELSGVTEMLSILIMVVDTGVYGFVKTHPSVRFE